MDYRNHPRCYFCRKPQPYDHHGSFVLIEGWWWAPPDGAYSRAASSKAHSKASSKAHSASFVACPGCEMERGVVVGQPQRLKAEWRRPLFVEEARLLELPADEEEENVFC